MDTPAPTTETTTSAPNASSASTATPSTPAANGAQTTAPATTQAGAQTSAGQTQQTETPSWSPNYRFKVMEKEHEIAEWLRPVIKDAETEKLARELHEKAMGLDVVKPRFQEMRDQFKTTKAQLDQYTAGVNELRQLYARGDFESFFKKLQIPEEKVLQWVVEKARYNQLPPEQRQVLDQKRAAEERAYSLEREQALLKQQAEESSQKALQLSLHVALEKPDVKAFATEFNARAANPQAFWNAVVQQGELAWYQSQGKQVLPPEEAIKRVMDQYQGLVKPTEAPVIPVQGIPAPATPAAAPVKKTPTLPNVAGRSATAVSKAKPKTIDDLKKLAAAMSAS